MHSEIYECLTDSIPIGTKFSIAKGLAIREAMDAPPGLPGTPQSRGQRLLEVLSVFGKIGAMSYGGPAIMGVIQTEIQQRRGWM